MWDERVPGTVSDNVTVNFGSAQPTVLVFDPTIGTTATQTYSNVSSIPFTLSDHPQILQISAPPPPPPVAANETATTSENTPVVVNLGTGATWGPTSEAAVASPVHGSVTISGLMATYTPNAGFSGTDTFTFTLTGAGGVSNVATISVTASVAGSLSGTVSAAAPPYNLTTLGTHDWRHWGRTNSYSIVYNHDASGGSQISGLTWLGPATRQGATSTPR